ncbi:FAD-binding oxidoreductase [Phytohabitans houttuyneae]|uniref:FAD-linked oxidase n=1 Tax=Phytohabitans houttuyneae TaxID=1076126 RepID=A0A6V8KUQ3_9ACTN|nr:FAD-binding oxidoreductase [Phytohabitans houttuyneae]GFJ85557.1 FAD-linked oxidase [Phytohabitans houttuyneae]
MSTDTHAALTGDIIRPGDEAYDRLRRTFVHEGEPAVIVRCHDGADVRRAIRYAREHDLVLSVRSGGHNGVGFGTNTGGVVIDLGPIDAVEVVDAARGLVRIGSGARWREVAAALATHGLALSSGDTASVGVGGLMLGGGIGWLVRKHGLALDSLVAAEVVTADGDVVRASAHEHPDLLWALRGGGGNFGVVTTFEVLAYPVGDVLFGSFSYPAEEAAAVLRGWRDFLRAGGDEVTTIARVAPSFGGPVPPVEVAFCVPAGDEEAARSALELLRKLGTVVAENVTRRPYPQVLEEVADLPPGFRPAVRNGLVPSVTDELIDTALARAGEIGTVYVELRGLGGAFGRVAEEATAFAHRDSEAMLLTVQLDSGEAGAEAFAGLWRAVGPMTRGAYGNFLTTATADDVATMYPDATYRRLAAVKEVYDPTNLFSHNHNVPPRSPRSTSAGYDSAAG